MKERTYDLRRVPLPDMAVLSVSDREDKPKVFSRGFERAFCRWEDLHRVTAKFGYSTMTFRGGHRLKANVTGYGTVYIFDVDDHYTIDEVRQLLHGVKSLIVTTRSHTPEHHKFRVLMLADKEANANMTGELYRELMGVIADFTGLDAEKLDKACLGNDRQYAPNNTGNQQHWYVEGDKLPMPELLKHAQRRLEEKRRPKPKPVNYATYSGAGGTLKLMREGIKAAHSFELMREVLEERGLTVKDTGDVIIPGNPTTAIRVFKDNGVLIDSSSKETYDAVSVLHDRYNVPLADATRYVYEKIGRTYDQRRTPETA